MHNASNPLSAAADARWFTDVFHDRAWIAAEFACAFRRSRAACRTAGALARERIAARRGGATCTCTRGRGAHCRTHSRQSAGARRSPNAATRSFPNGERHLRSRACLSALYPRELTDATLDLAERCTFSLDELRYEYPEELIPAGTTAAAHLRTPGRRRVKTALWRHARQTRSPRPDRIRAGADRRVEIRAVLSSPSTTSSPSRVPRKSYVRAAVRRPTRRCAMRWALRKSTRRG